MSLEEEDDKIKLSLYGVKKLMLRKCVKCIYGLRKSQAGWKHLNKACVDYEAESIRRGREKKKQVRSKEKIIRKRSLIYSIRLLNYFLASFLPSTEWDSRKWQGKMKICVRRISRLFFVFLFLKIHRVKESRRLRLCLDARGRTIFKLKQQFVAKEKWKTFSSTIISKLHLNFSFTADEA